MSSNPTIRTFQAVCTIAVVSLFGSVLCRCASIMTPEGGPRDTLPPVIVNMQPDNFTTNFTGTKIYIEFDEYVQLKDQNKEFFTSPAMKKKPTLSLRGKGVVVVLRDTLLENTTYALNFGSTIRDNNENNPLNAMRYVFSTGPEIDSMLCSGYTADGYKADSVSKSYIWFFPADSIPDTPGYDSTMYNLKPAVIARAENNGIFIAQNLKPIPYRVYAYQDKNDNQLYDAGSDLVGFVDGVWNPAEMPDFAIWYDSLRMYPTAEPQLYFRMFTDQTFRRQLLQSSERPQQHKVVLNFGAPYPQIDSIRFDSIPDERIIIDPQTRGRDTVALWFRMPAAEMPDTLRGEIVYYRHDSIRQLERVTEKLKLPWRYIESKEEEKERLKEEKERERAEKAGEEYTPPKKPSNFKYKMPTSGEINPEKHLEVEFDFPIEHLDSTAVQLLMTDASGVETPQRFSFVQDTSNIRRWHINSRWVEGAKYRLHIPEGAITDIAGQLNDSISGNYTAMEASKYATVIVRVKPRNEGDEYVIQLTSASGSVLQERRHVTGGEVQFNYVPAGEVRLRLVEDKNGNGEWDTGNVIEGRQPERTELYVNADGENTFATKANWEMELDVDMGEAFAPVTMESLIKMLDEREEQRLKKLEEEREKRNKNNKGNDHNHNNNRGNSGGFGGMGGMGGVRNATSTLRR
ncbi:MAG: Ig-like domain-containing protein [Alistipes sp.]|nr:Ig-like domain-containing protein [Alistipes sp.]